MRHVVGLLSYYPNFAVVAEPLTRLTRKNVRFLWKEEQETAFNKLIMILSQNAALAHLNSVDPIVLETDASKVGVAGILLQLTTRRMENDKLC